MGRRGRIVLLVLVFGLLAAGPVQAAPERPLRPERYDACTVPIVAPLEPVADGSGSATRGPGQEGCAPAASPSPEPEFRPVEHPCGTYSNANGVFDLVVVRGDARCDEARSVFERFDAAQPTDPFFCADESADIRAARGVVRFCCSEGARYELRVIH